MREFKRLSSGDDINIERLIAVYKEASRESINTHTHAHTNINEEPDRARIRWRKNKKFKLRKGKTIATPKRYRPAAKIYWNILREAGRNLKKCEICDSDYKITVHHLDGNPFNNNVQNLQILCWHCHSLKHNIDEAGIRHELEGTKLDLDPLDDPEIANFLGIVDEEKFEKIKNITE